MHMKSVKILWKVCLLFILSYSLTGQLNAQNTGLENLPCDSVAKLKIESSVMYALAGRMVNNILKPENSNCEIGKYSFDIEVNKSGEIISLKLNKSNSSVPSEEFLNAMLKAIRSSSFIRKENAPSKQKGNITYIFKLKDKSN